MTKITQKGSQTTLRCVTFLVTDPGGFVPGDCCDDDTHGNKDQKQEQQGERIPMKIRQSDFIRNLEGQQISLDKLQQDRALSPSTKEQLKRADLNRDGFIRGAEETSRLFEQIDRFDRDGVANTVDTSTAAVLTIQQALTRATESTPSTTPTPSTPTGTSRLQELLVGHPEVRTNQDLLNLLLQRNRNNWNAAGVEARRLGLDINDLVQHRDAPVSTTATNHSAPTNNTTPTSPGTAAEQLNRVAGADNTSAAFRQKVVEVAERLQMDPVHLMAVMSFETGESFSSSERNRHTGATGLIQFMPSTARHLGTSTTQLRQMTPERQLDYVERYLQPYAGKMNTLEDAYMAVLWPAAVGKGPNHVLFRSPSREYRQNDGLDINNNGAITAREAASKVRDKIQ